MRYLISFLLTAFLFSAVSAQTCKEDKEFKASKEIDKTADVLILQLDKTDIDDAARENADVFRILPREKYDTEASVIRGGGAYYSFVKKSHSYNDIPQIELQQGNLSVGFYGASFGFIADLGEILLAEINQETRGVKFLATYEPPTELSKARLEQQKGRGFEEDGIIYKSSVPAIVGNTYILRAVSYGEADILVAFKVQRKDADGSVIIFAKTIKTFEPTELKRTDEDQNIQSESAAADYETAILNALKRKGFNNVTVDYSAIPLTLRGTAPKGKLAEAVQIAQEAVGKPVRNEITEK